MIADQLETMASRRGIETLNEITCPNCWQKFPLEETLAIAGHGDLMGDPMLPNNQEHRRFVPTRFTPECAALDEMDTPSFDLACPRCHLLVPRVVLERRDTVFLSIFGGVGSGKSYFLTALSRQFDTSFPQWFGLGVTEPHPASNAIIRDYQNRLFGNSDPDALVDIPATQPSGNWHYQEVQYGGEVRRHPRPMYFQVAPTGRHPNAKNPVRFMRTICLYDNSGEHFHPQWAKPSRPETEHLARSAAMMFVFDPTREPVFLENCPGSLSDSQSEAPARAIAPENQAVILATADQNVKKWLGREIAAPLDTPLVVVVAKFDAWRHLARVKGDLPPFATGLGDPASAIQGFRVDEVERVSRSIREFLLTVCPLIVSTAERLSRRVCYIPTSATGCSPVTTANSTGGAPSARFRRGSIRPIWAEVPLLWILQELTSGLVPVAVGKNAPPRA